MRKFFLGSLLGLLGEHIVNGDNADNPWMTIFFIAIAVSVLSYVDDFLARKKTVTVILKDGRYADPE